MNITGCDCANSVQLPQLVSTKCGENVGQIQIAALVDLRDFPVASSTTPVAATSCLFCFTETQGAFSGNITTKAGWTYAVSSASTKKVIMTPMLYEFEMTPGEVKMWGEDNSTPDGRGITMGTEKTTITCSLRKAKASQVKLLKDVQCLAEQGNLGVLFFNEAGHVIGKSGYVNYANEKISEGGTDVALIPFKCIRMTVSDRKFGGLDEPDSNAVSISLVEGWSNDMKIIPLSNFRGTDLIQ